MTDWYGGDHVTTTERQSLIQWSKTRNFGKPSKNSLRRRQISRSQLRGTGAATRLDILQLVVDAIAEQHAFMGRHVIRPGITVKDTFIDDVLTPQWAKILNKSAI